MKKVKLLFIFLIIANQKLYSQSVLPTYTDNPTWNVITNHGWSNSCTLNIIKVDSPINLCSYVYYPILSCDNNGNNCINIGYYRIAGTKVYVRERASFGGTNCAVPEGLMYDYSLAVGDTAVCWAPGGDTKFWNVNQSNIVYEGVSRATSAMHFNMAILMNWINGIGSNVHPFYSLVGLGDASEQEHQLIKATVNGATTYLDTTLIFSCSSWTDIKSNKAGESLRVYPKLTTRVLNIDNSSDKGQYQIINLFGQVVENGNFAEGTNTLNIEWLSAGIYFINLNRDKQLIYQSKIIKED